jgi:hypothetical protein
MYQNGDTVPDDRADGRSWRGRELLGRQNPATDGIRRSRCFLSLYPDGESPRCIRGRSRSPLIRHGDTRVRAGNWSILFVDHDAIDQSVVARVSEGTGATTTSVILARTERCRESCKYEGSGPGHGYLNGYWQPR